LPLLNANAARILHISDLHFGLRFQRAKWESLQQQAKALAPDIVMVTGDLVNTPWFWMLKRARRELDALSAVLGGTTDIWVIPGNHDTRITGLLPVKWLTPAFAAGLLIAACWFTLGIARLALPFWARIAVDTLSGLFLLIATLCLILRVLVRVNLASAWGDYFLTSARCSSRVPVGVVPFDSASQGVSWARGKIPEYRFAKFRSEMVEPAGSNASITWIAAVHHHPLPLPYDDSTEQMMAMDNAGALMNELSRAGIRLVLHGHKHHQHFARIVVDPAQSQATELAVLSAGTPTSARTVGAFWHGFNVIDIDAEKRIKIGMYEAPPRGGTFDLRRTLDLATFEEQDRRRYLDLIAKIGVSCDRMLCVADITGYGDARFVREFRGVSAIRDGVEGLSGPYVANTTNGLVEAFNARPLSQWGPAVSLKLNASTTRRIEAQIAFAGSGLQINDLPIDFVLECYANNAFALNRWQFECMYPDRVERNQGFEDLNFAVPKDIALQELFVHVQFPSAVQLPHRMDIRQRSSEGEHPRCTALPRDCLVRIESQHAVQIRVRYPAPGSVIELNWEPHENTYPTNDPQREQAISRALRLREQFATLQPGATPDALRMILENLELNARTELGEGVQHQTVPYDLGLFAFDAQTKQLAYVAGTFAANDPRRKGRYAFGLGMVGRAYKTASNVAFRRPAYLPTERPWGYVTPDGRRVSSRRDVPEAIILAIPLAPPEALDWPYGVLQISTDSTSCLLKTADTASDKAIERYCAAVRELTSTFEAILR
jgi:3',5'-cyclic AMP phosphodiesterase CpdA